MSLLDEFDYRYTQKPAEPAKIILFGILDDITGRKGFDHVWDAIDDEIKEGILETNLETVTKNLS